MYGGGHWTLIDEVASANPIENLGVFMSGADLYRDGYSDYIIGNSSYNTGGQRGRVFDCSEQTLTPLYDITGENNSELFGCSVSAGGDINDDG